MKARSNPLSGEGNKFDIENYEDKIRNITKSAKPKDPCARRRNGNDDPAPQFN